MDSSNPFAGLPDDEITPTNDDVKLTPSSMSVTSDGDRGSLNSARVTSLPTATDLPVSREHENILPRNEKAAQGLSLDVHTEADNKKLAPSPRPAVNDVDSVDGGSNVALRPSQLAEGRKNKASGDLSSNHDNKHNGVSDGAALSMQRLSTLLSPQVDA